MTSPGRIRLTLHITNGKIIMVSYLYVEDAQTTSYVAFYNFGDSGQSEIDNIVSGYTYKDVIVPQTIYLKDGSALAFRDNGFSVYQGENIPKEKKNVEMTSEIVSTFYNDNYAGVVFKDKDNNKNYVMRVYSLNGKMKFEKKFNIEYTQIKISNEMIIMNNDTQVCMVDLNGNKKFDGTLEREQFREFSELHPIVIWWFRKVESRQLN